MWVYKYQASIPGKDRHFYASEGNWSWVLIDVKCSLGYHVYSKSFERSPWRLFLLLSGVWVYEGTFHSNKQLKVIVLTGNSLTFLSDTAFTGLQSLRQLVLTRTGITSRSFIPVTNLDSLGTLNLGTNHIFSLWLPPNFPTQNLKYLDFQMNNVRVITAADVHFLQKTSNITLIFKGNGITYIEPGAFQSHFYSLESGGYADVPEILAGIQNSTAQTLWLWTFHEVEKEVHISPNVLQGLCNVSVEDLYLQIRQKYCKYCKNLNTDAFQCLTKLQKLDLTQTYISALPPGISAMSSLTELVLNANTFEHLCNISSASFPSLTHLHIKENSQVLQLGSGCLEKLAKLQHLDLSQSRVESLSCCNEALSGLSSLQYLNLSHNTQLHLQDMLIRDSANLELLDLAFTPFTSTLNKVHSEIYTSCKWWIFPPPTLTLAFSISFKAWKTSCSWTLVKITLSWGSCQKTNCSNSYPI